MSFLGWLALAFVVGIAAGAWLAIALKNTRDLEDPERHGIS